MDVSGRALLSASWIHTTAFSRTLSVEPLFRYFAAKHCSYGKTVAGLLGTELCVAIANMNLVVPGRCR